MALATSPLAGVLPVLLVLACPLMMIFMMRGMHSGHVRRDSNRKPPRAQMSIDELRRERDELNEEIGRRAERAALR